MRIRNPEFSSRNLLRCRDDLLALLSQPTDTEARPCRGCDETCPCPQYSRTCCCQCSAQCPMASRKLSIDGERHPIEPHVLPLVYALSALRIIEPCWSCEGHISDCGESKTPQVWFYSGSVVYPDLLQRCICRLSDSCKLSTLWEVSVCPHQPESAVTLFVVRPESRADFRLGLLQDDLRRIGESLIGDMRELAEALLNENTTAEYRNYQPAIRSLTTSKSR